MIADELLIVLAGELDFLSQRRAKRPLALTRLGPSRFPR